MAQNKEHKVLYLRMPLALHTAITKLAEQDKRSITQEAEFILDGYIKQRFSDYKDLQEEKPASQQEV